MKTALQYLGRRIDRPLAFGGPSIHFDFVGGLINDIGKAVDNAVSGRDLFAGIGGVAGTIGTIINGAEPKPSSSSGSSTSATSTVPVVAGGTSFDAAPLILLVALAAGIWALSTQTNG